MQAKLEDQAGQSEKALPEWNDIKPAVQRLKWDVGQVREVVMIGDNPDHHVDFNKKDNAGENTKERMFIFNCQEAGKDVEIGTSSPNFLAQLRRFNPFNGKKLKISKLSKGGKQFYVVEEVK